VKTSGSQQLQRLLLLAGAPLALLALLGLGVLYWLSRPLDERAMVQATAALRTLHELDARWYVMLLRSRTDIDESYRISYDLKPRVFESLDSLREAAARLPLDSLRTGVPQLVDAYQEKSLVTSRFLAETSFMTDTLVEARALARTLQRESRLLGAVPQGQQTRLVEFERSVAEAMTELLAYSVDVNPARLGAIDALMETVTAARVEITDRLPETVEAFARAAGDITRRARLAESLIDAGRASPATQRLDELSAAFDAEMNAYAIGQQRVRSVLVVYAIALLALLALLGYGLVRSYRTIHHVNVQLQESNESLERRVLTTVRELRQSESQLVQAEKMSSLGQMVAGVAHEINTPLAYVKNNLGMVDERLHAMSDLVEASDRLVRMLQSGSTPEHELRDQFALVTQRVEDMRERDTINELNTLVQDGLHGIDQISEIVVNLKDFSRLDRGKVQPFDINSGLDSALLLARHLVKTLTVRRNYGQLRPVLCAPSQINQVFLNLITNAAQAIDGPDGVITVTTKMTGSGTVVVEITDNGRGIAPDVLPRVFDPFFTTKEMGKGTGLGLSISYKIVEEHGGKVLVRSKLGAGTTFTVLLPGMTAEAPAPSPPAASQPAPADPAHTQPARLAA
jgi:signal transduction histidine kinase